MLLSCQAAELGVLLQCLGFSPQNTTSLQMRLVAWPVSLQCSQMGLRCILGHFCFSLQTSCGCNPLCEIKAMKN